jgi:hypothetical protein
VLHFAVLIEKMPYYEAKYFKAYTAVQLGVANDSDIQLVVNVGTKAEDITTFASTAWNFWVTVNQAELNTLAALASGDLQAVDQQSETLRWLGAYMVEAMVAINNEYVEASPFKRGEIKGRITLEALLIILPATKVATVGQLSKLEFLNDLKNAQWVQGNQQLINILTKVIELVQATKPPPVIANVTPPLLPAVRVGTDIGVASERVAGKTFVEVQQALSARQALVDALATVAANAGDGPVTIRFKALSDLLLSGAPQQFASEEDAFAFLSKQLTYNNWKTSTQSAKQIFVVLDDGEQFIVPAGKAGVYEGNHILVQELQKTLRDSYGVVVGDIDDTPVKIMLDTEHQYAETSFHVRLDNWNGGILARGNLQYIAANPEYPTAASVLNEYLRFLKANPDYSDMIPVVRAFAKVHVIPITE